MKTFENFKWAVTYAFRDPLAKCLFERGDTIYDNKSVYNGSWAASLNYLNYSIQITKPEKLLNRTVNKKGESVFTNNWKSEAELTLTNHRSEEKVSLKTFQGNIYSTIWKGSLRYIESNSIVEIPHSFTFVHQNLEKLNLTLGCGLFFIYAIDVTSVLHSQKTNSLFSAFGELCEVSSVGYSELCSKLGTDLLPTTKLNILKIQDTRKGAEFTIKNALYSQLENYGPKKEMFRVRSHGLLIEA